MMRKIKDRIWQFSFEQFGSNVYLVKINRENILVDSSSLRNRNELENYLKELGVLKINTIILTHAHWDHVENMNLFPGAKIYGSKKDFQNQKILDIKNLKIPEFEIIETPGHSKGSFCILYNDVLFSGDTIFHNGIIGRTDLPGSSETEMKNSLQKLKKIKFRILCPGH